MPKFSNDFRMTLLDWEDVDIGDPAYDVGYAYHFVKFFSNPQDPNSAESIANRFLLSYTRNFKGDVLSRLMFYKVVGILGTSIFYSSGLSNPIKAYRYHRRKFVSSFPFLQLPVILIAFPFLRWPLVARQLNTELDINWLKYFEDFIENLE